ncbi:hypothetical protein E1301_Tti001641 [Triplophysa tibetana]|uniref:Uncharacterized protein n=1 Tax=Triplophysa tibetana TaxID=1572043 RepID=A0A5A9P7Y5_9TELE|nr:hypothetical protein E1301_Tti001641 [Triplophysa tibetana]
MKRGRLSLLIYLHHDRIYLSVRTHVDPHGGHREAVRKRRLKLFSRAKRRRAGSRCEFRQEGCQAEAVRRCFLMPSSHQQGCQSRRFCSTLRN